MSTIMSLSPGILLKLLDGMNSGAIKPVGEHRSALLQVTDIVPAELDEKDLLPKHGFYIKVSDSAQSIYATLPLDQVELVLSNKIQLGQLIYVDRLKPGTPVPVIYGVKPIPGRHPFIGTPEPIIRVGNHGDEIDFKGEISRHRGSWESEKKLKARSSSPLFVNPINSTKSEKTGSLRSSVIGVVQPKVEDLKVIRSCSTSKSSVLSKLQKEGNSSGKVSEIAKSPFSTDKKLLLADSSVRIRRLVESNEGNKETNSRLEMPGKLTLLQKGATMNREKAQKLALQALRDASAAENLLRVLKIFSDLIMIARPASPAPVLGRYLYFHEEILQVVLDMEKIQAATLTSIETEKENEDQFMLEEIPLNIISCKKKGYNMRLNNSSQQRADALRKTSTDRKIPEAIHMVQRNIQFPSSLSSSIKLAKEAQTEAGNWFMEFLEAALELGKWNKGGEEQSSRKCSQSLILKVINWVEVEQSNSCKRSVHPKAALVARKLRIKAKTPKC